MDSILYPLFYKRLSTRVVKIGPLKIGGNHPILIQSMLSSATHQVGDCIREIKALRNVDCRLIRLTIPSRKDLKSIPEIRRIMREEGIDTPLVADIHFSPQLAIEACEWFEKIRINPGNFSDLPKSSKGTQDGASFDEGYEKLKETIRPLADKLKYFDRALRIGVNHGSLSSRMIERFGDSPRGMVESAVEILHLFEDEGFDQIVVSLKSSNPIVVQKAYRLLVQQQFRSACVPLHLGVTEAGNGTMGRIKSLVGIGSLLIDGIGDTIRVSLTEPSINEIVFARELLASLEPLGDSNAETGEFWERPVSHNRVVNREIKINGVTVGGGSSLKLAAAAQSVLPDSENKLEIDFNFENHDAKVHLGDFAAETISADLISRNRQDDSDAKILLLDNRFSLSALRHLYARTDNNHHDPLPPIIGLFYPGQSNQYNELFDEINLAAMLSEGLIDFLLINESIHSEELERLICLLQATRSKIVVTEYITCPSCGRTLYDLEKTVAEIKKVTSHLKGLKIGIMGCIVNGPGEMADADFGYVGSGPHKVDLYYGQTRVKRGVIEKDAVEQLVKLIKEKGRWQEKT